MANMPGRFFRVSPGLGELPDTALDANGTMIQPPPFGRPPPGNAAAPTSTPGVQQMLGDKQSSWGFVSFVAGLQPVKIQDTLMRKFFLIQNLAAAGTIYVGFDYQPTSQNGLVLPAGIGYEPYSYPINSIWVAANAASVNGLLMFGV